MTTPDDVVHRLPTEGADLLVLAGVVAVVLWVNARGSWNTTSVRYSSSVSRPSPPNRAEGRTGSRVSPAPR